MRVNIGVPYLGKLPDLKVKLPLRLFPTVFPMSRWNTDIQRSLLVSNEGFLSWTQPQISAKVSKLEISQLEVVLLLH